VNNLLYRSWLGVQSTATVKTVSENGRKISNTSLRAFRTQTKFCGTKYYLPFYVYVYMALNDYN
jgi:hypothetical protein